MPVVFNLDEWLVVRFFLGKRRTESVTGHVVERVAFLWKESRLMFINSR